MVAVTPVTVKKLSFMLLSLPTHDRTKRIWVKLILPYFRNDKV